MPLFKDRTGEQFGRLKVLFRDSETAKGRARWVCECACGKRVSILATSLARGATSSCGCLRSELAREMSRQTATHGESRIITPEYVAWRQMKSRCKYEITSKSYRDRGISVCPEWENSYEEFLAHVGRRPSPSHSLDRIDNDKGYVPGNVRWALRGEQARNKRTNRLITYKGVTKCAVEWAEATGIPARSILRRLRRGFPLDVVFHPGRITNTRGTFGEAI